MWRRYLRAVRRFWIGEPALAGGGRWRPQQLSRLFALQPGESAGGREWVSSTPARTEEADRPQHPIADRSRNSRAHVAPRKPNELAT